MSNESRQQVTTKLLSTAAMAMAADGGLPEPDWLDDRDVAVMCIISAAAGLAELLGSCDDLGDGLMSGRYALAVGHAGVQLLVQPLA